MNIQDFCTVNIVPIRDYGWVSNTTVLGITFGPEFVICDSVVSYPGYTGPDGSYAGTTGTGMAGPINHSAYTLEKGQNVYILKFQDIQELIKAGFTINYGGRIHRIPPTLSLKIKDNVEFILSSN